MNDVTISARTLAIIERELGTGLRRLRIAYRAEPEIYRDLVTITKIASCADATEIAAVNDVPETWLSTKQAAQITGLSQSAITKAIRERRLPAAKHSNSWFVNALDLAKWRSDAE